MSSRADALRPLRPLAAALLAAALLVGRPLGAALLVGLAGCGSDPTRIVVVVDSELPLASVHARVGEEGCTGCEHDFDLESGAVTLPFSFVLAPRGGDVSREVALRVEGDVAGSETVLSRTVRTGFRPGRTVLLEIVLSSCATPCEASTTCIAGACVDDFVDPETLPDVVPGRELERDAGTAVEDGGDGDGGDLDGGGVDAGADGGSGEGGTTLPTGCGPSDDGLVLIDPDREGSGEPFVAFCRPSDGVGWMLIANSPSDSTLLAYDSAVWTDEGLVNESPGVGASDAGVFRPYWQAPVTHLRIVMTSSAGTQSLIAPLTSGGGPARTTVREAMAAPGSITLATADASWPALVGVSVDLGGGCTRSAIDASLENAQVRIGAVWSRSSCTSAADAWFGVGASVTPRMGGSCTSDGGTGGHVFCGPMSSPRVAGHALVFGRDAGG